MSRNPGLANELRIAALESLDGRAGPPDQNGFDLLCGSLAESAEPLARLAAARVLGKGPLTKEQLIRLSGMLKAVSPMVLRLLLPAFAASGDATIGTALVQALETSPAAGSLTVAELDGTLKGFPITVRDHSRGLREGAVLRQKGKAAYLSAISAEVGRLRGDSDAGQELFLSAKMGCFACHRAVGRGGAVGPDLSRIGKIRSKSELIESIVFPGMTVAPDYRTVMVATRDGRVTTGLVVRDNPESVTLRTDGLSEVRIPREEVEAVTPVAGSLMPEGMETIMSRQELCDLVEFLAKQG